MKIQLALDRLTIEEAIHLGKLTEEYVDWIEVGTSLIKEFGVDSIKRINEAFPNKTVVADVKTIDNARYEFEMCFNAGADVATVMGVSPLVTVEMCMQIANQFNRIVMIDLLNTSDEQKAALYHFAEYDAYFCDHISKDEQELVGKRNRLNVNTSIPPIKIAIAGGINLDSLHEFTQLKPDVVIIGSAITKADDPREAAKAFKNKILQWNKESL